MKKLLILLFVLFACKVSSQVGINTTNPSATLHVFGNTVLPSSGGTVNLLSQNFNGPYSVIHSNNSMLGCTTPATNGWERTTTGNANVNCSSCTSGWLFINSDQTGCGQNATARIDFTSIPSTNTVSISFSYRYNNFSATGDSFRAYLYNNTTNSQVGGNLVGLLTTDANTNYSGTLTVVPGNSYSLRFEYVGNFDYGASIDNILVTENSVPTPGSYTFRLEDGTQGVGKVLTSDSNGNGYWSTVNTSGGTDSQILSVSGNNLSISNGNTVVLPSGGGSYTFENGLTNASNIVRLGGVLTQDTSINLDDNDLTFSSSSTAAFPGEIIFQGTNRKIIDTSFDDNYINFGGDATLDADDGTTFTDTSGSTYTKDFVGGFHNGSSGGSCVDVGSIEYFVDGTDEVFFEGSNFSPMTNGGANLGTPGRRWTALYAINGTIQTSDLRLKTNVNKLNYGLNEILKLNTITYNWKDNMIGNTTIPVDKLEKKIGFSAQQLLEVIPEVVESESWVPSNEEGDYKLIKNEFLGVNYSEIIPVLVNAIQEQQKLIEQLKVEIEKIKTKLK